MTRKSLIFICCLFLVGIYGCGKNSQLGEKGKDIVQITYGTWEASPHNIKYIEEVARSFEIENPDIKVKVVSLDRYDKLLVELAAGQCQDVFFSHYLHVAEMITRGNTVMPIDDFIKNDPEINPEDYFKPTIKALTHHSNLYGLPIQTGSTGLFYNIDLFRKEGIGLPSEYWTVEDFLTAAKKITKDIDGDGRIDQYGLLEPDWQDVLLMFGISNASLFSSDEKNVTLNTPQVIEGMQFFSDLRNKHKIVTMNPEAISNSGLTYFMTGKIGMMFGATWALRELQKIKTFEWDVTYVPLRDKHSKRVYPTVIAMANCIWAGTKHKEESYKFLKYFSSKKGLTIYSKSRSGIPPLKSLAFSDVFMSSPPEHIVILFEGLDEAPVAPMIKNRTQVFSILKSGMEEMYLGLAPVKETAASMATEIESIINEQ